MFAFDRVKTAMGGSEEEKNHVQAQVLDEQGMSSAFLKRSEILIRLPVQGQVPHTSTHMQLDKGFVLFVGHSAHVPSSTLESQT